MKKTLVGLQKICLSRGSVAWVISNHVLLVCVWRNYSSALIFSFLMPDMFVPFCLMLTALLNFN